jgi:hypothetical protein
MTTKRRIEVPMALALSAFLLGCQTTTDPVTPLTRFAGTWNVALSEFVSHADASVRQDLIADGWTIRTQIDHQGRFTQTFTDPQGLVSARTGTAAVNGPNIVFTSGGVDHTFGFQHSTGNTITMTNEQGSHGFHGGARVGATHTMRMQMM